MDKEDVVVISGGSSGIGKAIASYFIKFSDHIYELSRTGSSVHGITHIDTDVSSSESVNLAIKQILNCEKKIDVLIHCAGYGISGAVEFTDISEAQRMFNTDLWGVVRLNEAVIPYMRMNHHGTILHISSVAAVFPIPFQAYYSSAKSAINSYSLALANELRPFSIRVCALQPGDVCTGFTSARKKSLTGDDIYFGRINSSVSKMEKDEQTGMSPVFIAKAVYRLLERKHPVPICTVGFRYKALVLLGKLLPIRLANWLLYQLYAK